MNTITGSMSAWSSSSIISVRSGARNGRRGPLPRDCQWPHPAVQGPAHHLVDALAFATRFAVPLQQGQQLRLLVLAPVHREVVAQHDRPLPFDDDRRVAAHRAQPPAELVGVVHGGREAHEADLGRREHEDLLPHATPVRVLEEVHFVEDDGMQGLEQVRAGQQHVAQDLGRHDHHGRPGPHRGVARQQADMVLAVGGHELGELLVREGLERRRVEGLAPRRQGPVDGVGRDQGLPRAGRGGDEDGLVGIEAAQGVLLEVVEDEREARPRTPPGRPIGPATGRWSTPEQLPDTDGDEIEEDEREGQGEHGERIRARGEHGGDRPR